MRDLFGKHQLYTTISNSLESLSISLDISA